jgi:transposase-like protein
MSNNSNSFDQQFKKDIIRLVQEENRSVTSIAKDFGVNEQKRKLF